jgi:SAM-dependent methyltransferase
MWAAVARSWEEHAAFIDARSAAVSERMLDLARPRPGDRVLELACGPGGVGLAAAERVSPGGEVVLSDVTREMTSIASARASSLGLSNVRTCELDLEQIAEPDASYDVVLCREGIMLVPDPSRAAREIRRVLRPGGRVALAVWGPRERNPWLAVLFDAASAQLGAPVPPPGIPGPFSLQDRRELAALLAGADLSEVVISEVPNPLRVTSFEEWWVVVAALSGPLARRLAALPEPARLAIRAQSQEAMTVYAAPAGLEIPGVTLVATATRE